jgi:hypothetical protein
MKYLVTKRWVVEVTEDDVKRFSARAGRDIDPRQIAITKAVQLLVELLDNAIRDPTDATQSTFDVELWEPKN